MATFPYLTLVVACWITSFAGGVHDWCVRAGAVSFLKNSGELVAFSDETREPRPLSIEECCHYLARLATQQPKHVRLQKTDTPAEGVAAISRLPSLEGVAIFDATISASGADQLSKLTHCSKLALVRVTIEDESLKKLCTRIPFRTLNLYECHISPVALVALQHAKHLESLSIRDTVIDTRVATIIGSCTQLRELTLNGEAVVDDHIRRLQNLESLRHLNLSHSNVTDQIADVVCRLTQLQELSVSNTRMTAAGLSRFRALKKLERFNASNLKGTGLVRFNLKDWSTRLRYLAFANTPLGHGALDGIERLSNIEDLQLQRTDIGDDDVSRIRNLPKLHTLNLCGTVASDDSVNAIVPTLKRLSELWLDSTPVTDKCLNAIIRHPSLKVVYVRSTSITMDGAGTLMARFQTGPGIWSPKSPPE